MGLGPYPTVTLEKARDAAAEARKLCQAKIDPIDAREKQRAKASQRGKTFSDYAQEYIAKEQAAWSRTHLRQWTNTIRDYAEPLLGDKPIPAIDTSAVIDVLKPIWGNKPVIATRLRGRIEAVIGYAEARAKIDGITFPAGYKNPALWRGGLKDLMPKLSKAQRQVNHHPALPYDEIPEFMKALRQQKSITARALEFTILTACRRNEAIGAEWSEFDAGKWTVPADRMKSGRQHTWALSQAAVALIEKQRGQNQKWVFPGVKGGTLALGELQLVIREDMKRDTITVHGFRSAFRGWAAAKTNYAWETCEMALAHTVGDETERAYMRDDMFEKRRQLAEDWAKFCAPS